MDRIDTHLHTSKYTRVFNQSSAWCTGSYTYAHTHCVHSCSSQVNITMWHPPWASVSVLHWCGQRISWPLMCNWSRNKFVGRTIHHAIHTSMVKAFYVLSHDYMTMWVCSLQCTHNLVSELLMLTILVVYSVVCLCVLSKSSVLSHRSFNRQKFAQKRIEWNFCKKKEGDRQTDRQIQRGSMQSISETREENRYPFICSQQFQSVLRHRYAIVLIVFLSNDLIVHYLPPLSIPFLSVCLCLYHSFCQEWTSLLSVFTGFVSRSLSFYDAFTPVYFHVCFFIIHRIVLVLFSYLYENHTKYCEVSGHRRLQHSE